MKFKSSNDTSTEFFICCIQIHTNLQVILHYITSGWPTINSATYDQNKTNAIFQCELEYYKSKDGATNHAYMFLFFTHFTNGKNHHKKTHQIVLQCENGKGAERRSYQSQDATSTSIETCNSAYNERWTYSDQQYGSVWHPETGTTSTVELRETSTKQFQNIIPNS